MTSLFFIAITGLVGVTAEPERPTDCEQSFYFDTFSAENAGYNRAQILAGGFYDQLECSLERRAREEYVLSTAFATHFENRACDLHVRFYFTGEYKGLLQRAAKEYLTCQKEGVDGFECIPRKTVGQYAGAVFVGFWRSTANHDAINEYQVFNIFSDQDLLAGEPGVCSPSDPRSRRDQQRECEEAIDHIVCGEDDDEDDKDDEDGDRELCDEVPEDILEELKKVVCTP